MEIIDIKDTKILRRFGDRRLLIQLSDGSKVAVRPLQKWLKDGAREWETFLWLVKGNDERGKR